MQAVKNSKQIKEAYELDNPTYKKIFQTTYKQLEKDYKLLDIGLDWLRVKSDEINFNFEKYLKVNSTLWDTHYINIWDIDYMILAWNSSMGRTLSFITYVDYKGFKKPVAIFRILKNRLSKNYIIDVYGLAFQLKKELNFDIDYILNYFFKGQNAIISRVDYNFNYNCNNQDEFIKNTYDLYEQVKNKNNYKGETITFWLYIKKWREQEKVSYRLTTRFWFRLYNKTKNIYDLWIAGLYSQYEGLEVIRLEGVLWSNGANTIKFWSLEDIEKQVLNKIIWTNKIIETNNKRRKKKKTSEQLKKMKLDLNSRLKTYIMNGWSLEHLESLNIYIDNKENIKEWYF